MKYSIIGKIWMLPSIFYQLARGIYNILSKAKCGIRDWQNIRKVKEYDGQISLL